MVLGTFGGLVQDFDVVTLAGFKRQPRRPLAGQQVPLPRPRSFGPHESAPHAVDGLVVDRVRRAFVGPKGTGPRQWDLKARRTRLTASSSLAIHNSAALFAANQKR